VIRVPPGTVIFDADHGHVLKDLAAPGEQVVVAHGGKGGKGNTRFKSATNQIPREATPGGPGESRRLTLELKVIADVGLVGKPNAGKSTLLSRVSRARPEIADYPFTTKTPQLGIVQLDLDRSLVMADIPGLIAGAHAGAGLGHEFLRHVERTRVLIHLVEPMPMDGSDPVENYGAIRRELEQYGHGLATRPEIIAVSKAELPGADEVQQRLAAATGNDVLLFSSVTGQGLDLLLQLLCRTGQVEPVDIHPGRHERADAQIAQSEDLIDDILLDGFEDARLGALADQNTDLFLGDFLLGLWRFGGLFGFLHVLFGPRQIMAMRISQGFIQPL